MLERHKKSDGEHTHRNARSHAQKNPCDRPQKGKRFRFPHFVAAGINVCSVGPMLAKLFDTYLVIYPFVGLFVCLVKKYTEK
jgi:hypothetical protein